MHESVETTVQAEFMEGAWTLVLGRLKAGVQGALAPGAVAATRTSRPKGRRRSA